MHFRNMDRRISYRLALSLAALIAASHAVAAQSVISSLDGQRDTARRGAGVVSNLEEDTINDDTYASALSFTDWDGLMREYERFDGGDRALSQSMSHARRNLTTLVNSRGMAFNLPTYVDENGVDLYLLSEEGATIYSAIDFPVYLQDIDAEVLKWMRFYAIHKRAYTKRLFQRYDSWNTVMKEHFRNCGIPEELTELCLIESGCTKSPVSPAGAAGMWQLMPATARQYGLMVNDTVDQRMDPFLSLAVAAKVLTANYARLGDWTLAAAAYNCGAGRVISCARQAGRSEWNALKDMLPIETRNYIPSLLAIHYVWHYRDKLAL